MLSTLPDAVARVIDSRTGSVLGRGTILKVDHYPYEDEYTKPLPVRVTGAPNFRQIDKLPLYAVGQPQLPAYRTIYNLIREASRDAPTDSGAAGPASPALREALRRHETAGGLSSSEGSSVSLAPPSASAVAGARASLMWITLREEPLLYINWRPHVLRLADSPATTLATLGRDVQRLGELEARLRDDVLAEAARNGGNVLLHEEQPGGATLAQWEAVDSASIRTPAEVLAELTARLPAASSALHVRVPLTPDRAPSAADVDALLSALARQPPLSALVLNCQGGRGRSTWASAMACLRAHLRGGTALPAPHDLARAQLVTSRSRADLEDNLTLQQQRRGEYELVLDALRVLDGGAECKRVVDVCVDACGQVENAREAPLAALQRAREQRTPELAAAELSRALGLLERYVLLLFAAAYLRSTSRSSFGEWLQGLPELTSLLAAARAKPQWALSVPAEAARAELGPLLANRTGAVLGPNALLKLDRAVVLEAHAGLHPSPSANKLDELAMMRRSGRKGSLAASMSSAGAASSSGTGGLRGEAWLRMAELADGAALFAAATPTEADVQALLASAPEHPTLWVNLREEPLVYINGQPYVLRARSDPLRNVALHTGISDERLAQLEERLRDDVLAEALAGGARVLVHDETQLGALTYRLEPVAGPAAVATAAQLFQRLAVTYLRCPMTPERPPDERALDALLAALLRAGPNVNVVFSDQRGRGRASVACVVALLAHYFSGRLPLLPSPAAAGAPEYGLINDLLRVLPGARQLKALVDTAIDLCGRAYHLRNVIEDARAGAVGERQTAYLEQAVALLERYFVLIAYAAYLSQEAPRASASGRVQHTFSAWVASRPELATMRADAKRHAQAMLQPAKPSQAESDDEVLKVIRGRRGDVLTSGCLLKPDHFPGCQAKGLTPQLQGAPNLRVVPNAANVYGVAIPTLTGVRAVLDYIASRSGAGGVERVLWVSLREEPVLYICGMPYVLRNMDRPFQNLEYTGIEHERVHEMEARLKADVLAEAAAHHQSVVLHDEDDGGRLFAKCVRVQAADVLTCPEVFAQLAAPDAPPQYRVLYQRVPVTDERAPEPKDFDQLSDILRALPITHSTHIIFNCQMGRGRTTTGMVCAILICINRNATAKAEYLAEVLATHPLPARPARLQPPAVFRGEYPVVLRLLRVLEHGREAKEEVDLVLDHASHMQNLRDAIQDVAVRASAAATAEARASGMERARWYLERYLYLIIFSAYLVQLLERGKQLTPDVAFSAWLAARPELTAVLTDVRLE